MAFVNMFQDLRGKFLKQKEVLKVHGPLDSEKGIIQAYLYFKYIVRGDRNEDYLRDMDLLFYDPEAGVAPAAGAPPAFGPPPPAPIPPPPPPPRQPPSPPGLCNLIAGRLLEKQTKTSMFSVGFPMRRRR